MELSRKNSVYRQVLFLECVLSYGVIQVQLLSAKSFSLWRVIPADLFVISYSGLIPYMATLFLGWKYLILE